MTETIDPMAVSTDHQRLAQAHRLVLVCTRGGDAVVDFDNDPRLPDRNCQNMTLPLVGVGVAPPVDVHGMPRAGDTPGGRP
jgi:hypothetical protein